MRVLILFATMLLGGCQVTVFEHVLPGAGESCPTDIVGAWQGESAKGDPDFYAKVTENCGATLQLLMNGAWQRVDTRVAIAGEYLFVPVTDVWVLLEAPDDAPRSDGYFGMRYSVNEEQLLLAHPNHTWIAHRIIDGDIKGRLRKDSDLLVEVTETPENLEKLLREHTPFERDAALQLRRIDAIPDLDPTPP